MISGQTLVLNADYTFLNTVSIKKAICLVVKGKAEIVKKSAEKFLTNFEKTYMIGLPQIIRLIKIIRIAYKKGVPWSKRNIFIRDNYTCQYCGNKFRERSKSLTIDHIVPKSKNGTSSWLNCVSSCKKCNSHKSSKTPREAGLTLLKRPVKPTIGEFISLRMKQAGLDKILDDLFKEMV